MKTTLVVALCLATFGLAGCTDGIPDEFDVEAYDGPAAILDHRDVPVDGMSQEFVTCDTRTHLDVFYKPGDDATGDFSVRVYSESSREKVDEETGESQYNGIPVFPWDDDPSSFPGNREGEYATFIDGTAGEWLLEVHRSQEHDGTFFARLICV